MIGGSVMFVNAKNIYRHVSTFSKMQVTITTLDDKMFSIDVNEDLEIENLKAQCEFELGIPAVNIVLMWNGRPLHNAKLTLKDYGIKNGDVLLLQQMRGQTSSQGAGVSATRAQGFPTIDFSGIQIPGPSTSMRPQPPPQQSQLEDPKVIRKLILNDQHERALLKERNPPLSDALESGNENRFVEVFERQRKERLEREKERFRLAQMDPFDPEAQKLIAEEIRLKNVEANMENAIEHVPENFGTVIMLYIDCKVNGHDVKAFVDSGAQMTIMSQACAERCSIMRLVDTRWAGIAKGVGVQRIIGRVHLGQIQIENEFLPSSFSILEDQPMDMLLGLDMLKRHQCVIDLQTNQLKIGTTGTVTPFLSENQLPPHARGITQSGDPSVTSQTEDQEFAEAVRRSALEASGAGQGALGNSSSRTEPGVISEPFPALPSSDASNSNSKSSSGNSSTPQSAGSSFSEHVIQQLMTKGFSRDQVISELQKNNGDELKTLFALLAKSLKF